MNTKLLAGAALVLGRCWCGGTGISRQPYTTPNPNPPPGRWRQQLVQRPRLCSQPKASEGHALTQPATADPGNPTGYLGRHPRPPGRHKPLRVTPAPLRSWLASRPANRDWSMRQARLSWKLLVSVKPAGLPQTATLSVICCVPARVFGSQVQCAVAAFGTVEPLVHPAG